MNEDEIKDKSIGYRPDINYEDEYGTIYEGAHSKDVNVPSNVEEDDSLIDNSIMDIIQSNINEIVAYINGLPVDLQTAINQVFKPVFNDWYENLKDRDYPTRIPDPEKPIITPKDPDISITIRPIPGEDEEEEDENFIEDVDPIIGTLPPADPKPTPQIPSLYTPDPTDPVIPVYESPEPTIPPYDDLEDLFAPSSPFEITYEKIDPIEQGEMEYTKNLAELYLFFTNQLKEILGLYYISVLSVLMVSKTADQLAFVNNVISLSDVKVNEQAKHLMDSSLRSEVLAANKLSFCANTFPLESTLYHLKSFKSIHGLRMRYKKEEKSSSKVNGGSMSNNILNGLGQLYDKKYDVAYINLYKYLNSFTKVLSDMFNTYSMGLRSKETLIKKGEIK